MNKRRVIVDVDVGLDDYMALLLLFHAENLGEIKIEAIVCTNGNTYRENVCRHVVRLLETVKRTDIPVYRGALKPIIDSNEPFDSVHGADGLGDLTYDSEPNLCIIKDEPAAVGIRNLIINNPGEITLICVAALTNLALALRLDNDISFKIKDLWIMGGNYTAMGNIKGTAEFNFWMDPEAAYIVLDTVTKPIYILTWETVVRTIITRDWVDEVLGKKTDPAIVTLNRAELTFRKNAKRKTWLPCDAFLVAAFLQPSDIIVKQTKHHASVELHGSQTRGQVVIDHKKTKNENVTVIEEIHVEQFKKMVSSL